MCKKYSSPHFHMIITKNRVVQSGTNLFFAVYTWKKQGFSIYIHMSTCVLILCLTFTFFSLYLNQLCVWMLCYVISDVITIYYKPGKKLFSTFSPKLTFHVENNTRVFWSKTKNCVVFFTLVMSLFWLCSFLVIYVTSGAIICNGRFLSERISHFTFHPEFFFRSCDIFIK